MFSDLKQHHIGCLVHSISDFIAENIEVWPQDKYSTSYFVSSQDVRVCFLQMSPDTLLELVEPGPANQPLAKLLNKGITLYHIGFISNSYDESVERLLHSNCRQLSEFNSEAFDGKRCAFFYHPQIRLIELIEN